MHNPRLPYRPDLKNLARQLRKNSTLSEVLLWQQLKNKGCCGHDFHRQKPIDNYIVDFFCPQLMLAIEIDGNSHNEKIEEDIKRQDVLEKLGICFLRFSDNDIKNNMAGVVVTIEKWITGVLNSEVGGHGDGGTVLNAFKNYLIRPPYLF